MKADNKKQIIIAIISGVFVGFLNGFFGGGGGMIVVPVLIFLLFMKEKNAHATAIFVILPLCIASSIVYVSNFDIDYMKMLYVGIGVVVGGVFGALLLNKLNGKALRIIFSVIMIVAGVRMIF